MAIAKSSISASLVKELSRFIGRTFAKNIQVRMEIAPDLRQLYANPTQIYQVLLNLCVNARDAMPHGGELTITAGNVTLDEAAARALPGSMPGDLYRARGVRHRHGHSARDRRAAFSIRFSPPSRSAKAPASACRPCAPS